MVDERVEPAWMRVLRRDVAAVSQRAVARKLGVNVMVLNHVLRGKYRFTPKKLKAAVETVLMRGTVNCPGRPGAPLPLDACRRNQERAARPKNQWTYTDRSMAFVLEQCPGCANNVRNWK